MADFRLKMVELRVGMTYAHLPLTVEELKPAAAEGDLMAMCNLGWCFFNAVTVQKDRKTAVSLWKKAAEKGNAGSCYNLGYCYTFGIVVKQDDQISSDFFAKYHRCRNTERFNYLLHHRSS
ncbi:hypothetical protein GUITHDRAFT_104362 [Guillardia theta CCMP2712]|uniref:Sel1 repeat family protein n=2 Tax=Guillardia theta TaxID=55529 RepID=L1JND9_GUITC|nr:hypothetical protein GUITHDRAFT_104362 [Guillardia theta CCMP2712]EKX49967.1 hypothetical protein GUITHDRAFT_104362 [Guillardia theta CCMP2712]|mmetsp:Transcript_1647/g.5002  ORF Transcript_1647/g.5002 Transcript_1647/m.5002 type:complete len:121 (+) Transcript_1647:29-391(+)|eukprot:XP_005836947.1 hypothetical protein GUITHDRAFT_104362 [Guillardia theta CCMP2712]